MNLSSSFKARTYDIAVVGICSAILFISQILLSALPNIELVTLFVILFTIYFRYKALYSIYIFALLEGVVYGFSIWFISYLYIWTILFFIILIVSKRIDNFILFSIISAIFGLLFGTLSSIPYFFIGGFSAAIAYIVSGIPFDIIHCISNFIITMILFRPLSLCFNRIPFINCCHKSEI